MSKTHENPDKTGQITIVGGGLCGVSIVIEQINTYRALYKNAPDATPPLNIEWIEKSGRFGAGLAYDVDDDVFLLNQPASLMSPFVEDPDHFVRWLEKHAPEIDADGFATRQLYSQYLQDTLDTALHQLAQEDIPLHITRTTATVQHFKFQAGQDGAKSSYTLSVRTQDGTTSAHKTDALILATGHLANNTLKTHLQHDNYQQTPFKKSTITHALSRKKGAIGIIGTGQSMMDCLAALHKSDCQDKIYLFSRENIEPWPFHPKDFGDHIQPYHLQHIRPENIAPHTNYDDLISLFDKEVQAATHAGYNIGHVLIQLDKDGFAARAENHPHSADIKRFIKRIDKYYANPTTPQRYQLLKRLKDSGQVQLVKLGVDQHNIKIDTENNFAVGEKYTLAHLFNSAGFQRTARDEHDRPVDPLAKCADDFNLLARHPNDPGSLKPGVQNHDGLYIVGPQTNAGRWGVETFRPDNHAAAQDSLSYVLKTDNNQPQLKKEKDKNNVKNRKLQHRTHRL